MHFASPNEMPAFVYVVFGEVSRGKARFSPFLNAEVPVTVLNQRKSTLDQIINIDNLCRTQQLNSRLPAITHTFRGFKRTLSLFHLTANKAGNSLCLGCLQAPGRAAPLAASPLPARSAGGTGGHFGVPLPRKPAGRNRLLGGFLGVQVSSIQKQASGLHVCKHTYAQTHARPRTPTPISSRLLALLALISLCFPEAAPASGTTEPRTAPRPRAAERSGNEPHTNLCQLCSPFLAPSFEIYCHARVDGVGGVGVGGSCSESEEVASRD